MKKKILNLIILIILGINPLSILAQEDDHTAREEAEGKVIWENLQNKKITCADLADEQFQALGEFFMGQMTGAAHASMNQMMTQMMGEAGEEQMHIVMGKRLSGCELTATSPSQGIGFLPMMSGMMGGWGSQFEKGGENSMMWNFTNNPLGWMGFGFGWLFMIIFWVLIIWGIIALINWLVKQGKEEKKSQTALDILKERYAKGEIDKEEFEDKKKDLTS